MQAEKAGERGLTEKPTKRILEWREILDQLQEPIMLPVPIKLDLIRHAESKINANKRVTGVQDVELTPAGEEQAINLGLKLDDNYDLAFSSALKRSQKTLDIAIKSGKIEVGKIIQDYRLNERNLGVLEGQAYRWIPEYAYGDLMYAPEKGENYEKVAKRIFSFLLDLSKDALQERFISKVLISGHMGPMRIMIGILLEEEDSAKVLALKFSNTEVVQLTWRRLQIPGFLKEVIDEQITK